MHNKTSEMTIGYFGTTHWVHSETVFQCYGQALGFNFLACAIVKVPHLNKVCDFILFYFFYFLIKFLRTLPTLYFRFPLASSCKLPEKTSSCLSSLSFAIERQPCINQSTQREHMQTQGELDSNPDPSCL